MTAEHDPLEARLVRALAAEPTPDAAARLHDRVAASRRARASAAEARSRHFTSRMALLAASATVVVLVAVAIALVPRGAAPTPPVHTIPSSWPRAYADIAELAADAGLVVEGTVRALTTGPGGPVPMTRARVEVARVLQGDASDSIDVLQTGGRTPSGTWVMEGDPLMEVDEHSLLFLRPIGTTGPFRGAYVVLGGPQGRFDVRPDGTIAPIGETTVAVAPGTTVDDVAEDLAAVVDAGPSPSDDPAGLPAHRSIYTTCGGHRPYRGLGIEGPIVGADGDERYVGALHGAIGRWGGQFPDADSATWRLAGEDATGALLIARTDPPDGPEWLYIAIAIDPLPSAARMGYCDPRRVVSADLVIADWWLDPAYPVPGPETTELHVRVLEHACASGDTPEGRVAAPEVITDRASVAITIGIHRVEGFAFCPGNPSWPVTVRLSEPLGDRDLLDGSRQPPVTPETPERRVREASPPP